MGNVGPGSDYEKRLSMCYYSEYKCSRCDGTGRSRSRCQNKSATELTSLPSAVLARALAKIKEGFQNLFTAMGKERRPPYARHAAGTVAGNAPTALARVTHSFFSDKNSLV
eukprot:g5273.t1